VQTVGWRISGVNIPWAWAALVLTALYVPNPGRAAPQAGNEWQALSLHGARLGDYAMSSRGGKGLELTADLGMFR